jgi:hypothetical protein
MRKDNGGAKRRRTLLNPETVFLNPQRTEPSTDHVVVRRFIVKRRNALDIVQEAAVFCSASQSIISDSVSRGDREGKGERG